MFTGLSPPHAYSQSSSDMTILSGERARRERIRNSVRGSFSEWPPGKGRLRHQDTELTRVNL